MRSGFRSERDPLWRDPLAHPEAKDEPEDRRAEDALSVGDFAHLPAPQDLIAYVRKAGDRRLLVILNLGNKTRAFDLGELACSARLLISTYLDRGREPLANSVALRPDEGLIAELS